MRHMRWCWLLLVILFVVVFLNFEVVTNGVLTSMHTCIRVLIPSLFPFSVLSNFFCKIFLRASVGVGIKTAFAEKRFVPGIVLGWIGGFPIGASLIRQASYDGEDITREVCLSSCGSSGYVVGVIGGVLCKDFVFGACLYLFQIAFSVVLIQKNANAKNTFDTRFSPETVHGSYVSYFVSAVRDSALTMLYVCAFTVVFSTLSDLIACIFPFAHSKELIRVIFEFSTGGQMAWQTFSRLPGAFLVGFSVGFGGLSVHAQIYSFTEGFIRSYHRVIFFKLLVGLFCGTFSVLYFSMGILGIVFSVVLLLLVFALKNLLDLRRKNEKTGRRAACKMV